MRQLRSWHRVHVDFRVGRNSVHCRSLFAAKVTCMSWCFEDKDLFLWKFFCRLPSEVLRNGERRLITVFESSYLSGVFVIRRVQTCHFTPDPSCNMDFELFPKQMLFRHSTINAWTKFVHSIAILKKLFFSEKSCFVNDFPSLKGLKVYLLSVV